MSKIMIDLLPCPFCGGNASIHKDDYYMGPESIPGYVIKCNSCLVKMSDYAYCQTMQKARDNVIRMWNSRNSKV